MHYFLTFLLLFISHFTQVLLYTCFDVLMCDILDRFVIGAIFIQDNNLFKCEDEKLTSNSFINAEVLKWRAMGKIRLENSCLITHLRCWPYTYSSWKHRKTVRLLNVHSFRTIYFLITESKEVEIGKSRGGILFRTDYETQKVRWKKKLWRISIRCSTFFAGVGTSCCL